MSNSAIVAFYSGQAADAEGRRIEDIWAWDNQRLEDVHNYIQWLFPLVDRSRFNPHAPTLTEDDIQTFRASQELRTRVLSSFQRILQFYGLQCQVQESAIVVTPAANFSTRKTEWLRWGNHNHLRITRILTSLRVLGLEGYAQALFRCLTELYQTEQGAIDPRSYDFWKKAVSKEMRD